MTTASPSLKQSKQIFSGSLPGDPQCLVRSLNAAARALADAVRTVAEIH